MAARRAWRCKGLEATTGSPVCPAGPGPPWKLLSKVHLERDSVPEGKRWATAAHACQTAWAAGVQLSREERAGARPGPCGVTTTRGTSPVPTGAFPDTRVTQKL